MSPLFRQQILLGVIGLLLLASACHRKHITEPTPTGTPALSIPEPSFDFGLVAQNTVVAHRFWLYSTGTDTLKILNINPG